LLLGNGSDELIQMLIMAVAKPGAVVLGVEPSFVMFRMIAVFAGVRYVGVELRDDFSLDLSRVLAAMEREHPAIIFIAYPNNPSGNLFDAALIERILSAAPGWWWWTRPTTRSPAKASSGARPPPEPVGHAHPVQARAGRAPPRCAAGRGRWLEQLDKVRLPYNVNVLTQVVAREVLQHDDVLTEQAVAIKLERSRLLQGCGTAGRDGVSK